MAEIELEQDNAEHLLNHRVTPQEAEQVFFNQYVITPNKKQHGHNKYRIDGSADSGRKLRLIFEDLGQNAARIITGWDL